MKQPPISRTQPRRVSAAETPKRLFLRHGKEKVMRTSKRERLLEEGAKLFLKKGYDRTTMKDLGKAVGVQAAAIYYHFKSKNDLLEQIDEESFRRFRETILDPAREIKDPEERIKFFIRNRLTYQLELGKKALLVESISPRNVKSRKDRDRDVIHFLRDTLRELAQSRGLEDFVNPTVAAFSLHYVVSQTYKWYKPKGPLNSTQLADQIIRLFFLGFPGELTTAR